MKISERKIDIQKRDHGAWMDNLPDAGDLRVKVRGVGNRDWDRLQNKLLAAVPRAKKMNGLDPEERDRIYPILLVKTILLDWENLEDDDGNPIPYSQEKALELLTDPTLNLKEIVLYAANNVAEQVREDGEADAKN
jgi:hypothetical protein